jgi:hypothetical protein
MGDSVRIVGNLTGQPHSARDAATGRYPHLDAELLHYRRRQPDRAFLVMIMSCVIIVIGPVLSACVLCVVMIAFGMVMPRVFVVGMLRIVVIDFGMVLFGMPLVTRVSVPFARVFIICRMVLIGRRCGRRPEMLDRIGCPQRAKQEQHAQGGTNLHCWSPAL